MKPDDFDPELTSLREASERVAANLVELEIDSSRQLLEASALTGISAARWAEASAALTELWTWRSLLDELLERAGRLHRSPRNTQELRSLLTGPSIELTRSPIPLAERDLLGSAEVAVRCTPRELLERMSIAFDVAKTVVAQFAAAWETLTPGLASARAALEQARPYAASLDDTERDDLKEVAQRIDRLTTALTTDPLSVSKAEVDGLSDWLAAIHRDLEEAAALRGDLDARLGESWSRLATVEAGIEEARAAHEELVIKIAGPAAPAAPELPDDLADDLHQIARLARSGAWREARRELDAWTTRVTALLDDARRIAAANRAPLEARNQLRALLEAYQVKAGRVGVIEDPELERIFAQAHAALYSAPTDLAHVAQLVRRYQEIVQGAGGTRRRPAGPSPPAAPEVLR